MRPVTIPALISSGRPRRARRTTALSLVAAAAAGAAAAAVCAVSPRAALLFGALSAALLVMWLARRWLLVVLLVILWYIPGQTAPGGLLDDWVYFRWAGLLLVPIAAAAVLAVAMRRNGRLEVTPIFTAVIALVVTIAVSAATTSSSPVEAAIALVMYLRYPLLFLALANLPVSRRALDGVVAAFLVLVGLQFVEVVVRYFVLGASGDALSWSLGPWGTFPLGVYAVYAMCLVAGVIATQGVTVARVALLAALVIPAALGEIKALLIAGPLCAAIVLLLPAHRLIRLHRRLTAIAVLVVVGLVIFLLWSVALTHQRNLLADFVAQVAAVVRGTGRPLAVVNRIGWTLQAWQILQENGQLLFGAGPASSLAGSVNAETGRLMSTGIPGKTQIGAMLWDTGVAGLLAYVWILLSALWIILTGLRAEVDARLRGYALALVGMWVFYALLGPNYDLVWRADSASFLFWTLLAGVWAYCRGSDADLMKPVSPAVARR